MVDVLCEAQRHLFAIGDWRKKWEAALLPEDCCSYRETDKVERDRDRHTESKKGGACMHQCSLHMQSTIVVLWAQSGVCEGAS